MLVVIVTAASCGRTAFRDSTDRPPVTPTPTATATPSTLTLIREKFDTGNAGLQAETIVVWNDNDSSPGSFEVYTTSGAGARGMSSTYDADNNAGTPQVNIPGGIEVNDASSNVTLTATFTLPALAGGDAYTGGQLTFWGGLRGTPTGNQTIDIFDMTASTALTGVFTPSLAGGSTPRNWTWNTMPVAFTSTNAGHSIQVRFHGSGSNAEGLELADITLTATLN